MKKMETSSLSIYRDLHDLENMSLKNKFRIGNVKLIYLFLEVEACGLLRRLCRRLSLPVYCITIKLCMFKVPYEVAFDSSLF